MKKSTGEQYLTSLEAGRGNCWTVALCITPPTLSYESGGISAKNYKFDYLVFLDHYN